MKVKELIQQLLKIEEKEPDAFVFVEDIETYTSLRYNKSKNKKYALSRVKDVEELEVPLNGWPGYVIRHVGHK